jgi:hypothetical protein
MTQHDEAWLELAREALSPREADQARVLSALEQRLNLPPITDQPQLPSSDAPSCGVATAASHVQLLKLSVPRWLAHWVLPGVLALGGGAAVTVLATRSAQQPAPAPLQPVAAEVTPEPEMVAEAVPDHDAAETPQPEQPAPAAPGPTKPARKKCRTSQGVERPCNTPAKPAPSALASAPPPPAAAPNASLSEELAALREAQRALKSGQAAHALEVLTGFERSTPGPGAMQEERNAAATMARCTLDPEAASQLYEAFVRQHPNSAYVARLRRTCQPRP